MLGLFRKPYIVRKHGVQTVKRGYASSPYTDIKIRLNVQPQPPDNFEGRESGDATVKRLKSWGADRLNSADEINGIPGDLLYYQGEWYECKSCVPWDQAPLAHFQADFVILPTEEQFPDYLASIPVIPDVPAESGDVP